MEFRILGPVEVFDDGRAIALGPSKQRALLAILLLHMNEVVSRDRLIEDLWGERAPETAATALHGYVSQLRKALEQGVGAERQPLVTRAPGYLLELEPTQVDLRRFELLTHRGKRELSAGEAEAAAVTFAEALSLWRGPPLAEFSSAPFALAESLRLDELRISTLGDRIEADLALGRHDDLVGELEPLVAEHPFRERLCAQLMLALYRCGRQAEALEVYRRTRRRLVEELGIEPGPALQELEQAILRHEPALAPPVCATVQKAVETTPRVAERPERTQQVFPAEPARAARRSGRRVLGWRALALACVVAVTLALVLAFAFKARDEPSIRLIPNSVGFVDARTGRVSRSFPVGRDPSALAATRDSVWVANYQDKTVTRINRANGHGVTIGVGGHPTGLVAYRGTVWVWTLEALLVPIDPRFNSPGAPLSLAAERVGAPSVAGRITAGRGFLWITAPGTTVIRVDATNPRNSPLPIVPDAGVEGAMTYHGGKVWVAGANQVFPITEETAIPTGAMVGVVRDLAFGAGSLWVVSGGNGHVGGVVQALRRVDPHTGLVQATIAVGSDPVSVAVAGGSIWVAVRTAGAIERVDPAQDRAVDTISLGAKPTALASDRTGVWVAVR
jgi:DNA-binding SARP family transcriptional activator